jgi:hypothetical protein
MATLTHEEQAFLRTVLLTGMSTSGACLAGIISIDFHRHTACLQCLIGDVALQFSKGPSRGMPVRSALLLCGFLPMRALGALANVRQVFQANHAVWVLVHYAPADLVVGRLFQPSLPSANDHQSPGSGTGAFVLQPLSQAGIVVRFGPDPFAAIEGRATLKLCCDRQIALTYIDTDHLLVGFGGGICYLDLKGNQQIELLAGLVIPEFSRSNMRTVLHESKMLLIARVGDHHAPFQREDAHLVVWFQAVVAMVVISQRWGDIFGSLVQALVTLLGDASLAISSVLLHLGPERLVGSSDLARNVTSHLGRQMIHSTYFCIGFALQPFLIALLAMRKRVERDIVQGITIRQLRCPQRLELLRTRLQFHLRR